MLYRRIARRVLLPAVLLALVFTLAANVIAALFHIREEQSNALRLMRRGERIEVNMDGLRGSFPT